MAKDGISFAGNPDLIEWLEGRGDRSRTQESAGMRAKTELGLWRSVLRVELQRQHWTLGEMGLLADIHHAGGDDDAVVFVREPPHLSEGPVLPLEFDPQNRPPQAELGLGPHPGALLDPAAVAATFEPFDQVGVSGEGDSIFCHGLPTFQSS